MAQDSFQYPSKTALDILSGGVEDIESMGGVCDDDDDVDHDDDDDDVGTPRFPDLRWST